MQKNDNTTPGIADTENRTRVENSEKRRSIVAGIITVADLIEAVGKYYFVSEHRDEFIKEIRAKGGELAEYVARLMPVKEGAADKNNYASLKNKFLNMAGNAPPEVVEHLADKFDMLAGYAQSLAQEAAVRAELEELKRSGGVSYERVEALQRELDSLKAGRKP